jgi:hypothetical protein
VRNTVVAQTSQCGLLSAGFGGLKETEMYQDTSGVALISGASSGIGAIYADRLARL